ncbi:ParB/RepB/Spo0J family partition protein [Paracoccus aestuariivivens]|uniref:Chromosome partitioning protein ParB n=1 Tax=Paracoccus aestuariivivens TaxID=1820333 RepID=A0A6L6JDH3_9RHOB|nr:ParB N-terminal domain-containing protein [Paracoccus aestuariivivens]MTH79238.1 chromosome partitioning protein ParB [Paracoccus aestuariivivens]
MAKRRRLETPSTADLNRIEQEFRSETTERPPIGRGMAPISQVAAESASMVPVESTEVRAARARSEADASKLREAEERGLLIVELPIEQIDEGAMIRDRMVMNEEEMIELRLSIAAHGQRLPIEVFQMDPVSGQGPRFGLLSGYRRLQAMRELFELTQAEKHASIRALIRPRAEADEAFVAMVEENEVREELSHFERGRIAVIAAQQGAFANTEDAVNKLFATGSKAKRSKVRSFALIFEELGDMLRFPEALTERRGLRLSAALRSGGEIRLRQALSVRQPDDAEVEWEMIEPVLEAVEATPQVSSKGGRPRSKLVAGWIDDKTIRTTSGIVIRRGRDEKGHTLRLEGRALDDDLMDSLMAEIKSLLDR